MSTFATRALETVRLALRTALRRWNERQARLGAPLIPSDECAEEHTDGATIHPQTNLPMAGGGVDVEGNPF